MGWRLAYTHVPATWEDLMSNMITWTEEIFHKTLKSVISCASCPNSCHPQSLFLRVTECLLFPQLINYNYSYLCDYSEKGK